MDKPIKEKSEKMDNYELLEKTEVEEAERRRKRCLQESQFNTVEVEDLFRLNDLCSYITDTKMIDFCGDEVLKVSYAVEVHYTTNDCENKTKTVHGSVVFFRIPRRFDLCDITLRAYSVACEECPRKIKVNTIVRMCQRP